MVKRLLVFAVLLSLVLTACGAAPEASEPEKQWAAEFYDMGMDIVSGEAAAYGGYLYFCTEAFDGYYRDTSTGYYEYVGDEKPFSLYRWKIGQGEPEKIDIPIPESRQNSNNLSLAFAPDGSLYINYGNAIGKYSGDGGELFYVPLNKPGAKPEERYDTELYRAATDSDGQLYLLGDNTLCIFDTDCTLNHRLSWSGRYIAGSSDGSVYTADSLVRKILKADYLGSEPETVFESGGMADFFVAYTDNRFLTDTDGAVYLIDIEGQRTEELFTWANVGIDVETVQSYIALEDGSIIAFLKENDDNYPDRHPTSTAQTVCHIALREPGDKTVVTVGTFSATPTLNLAAASYNRYHTDSQIEIVEYYDSYSDNTLGGTGYQEALTRFQLDIASGSCPDILSLDYGDLQGYAEKGLFEDLTPYLQESGMELLGNVQESYTFDGILAAVPPTLKLRLFAGSSPDFEGIVGWTIEELMDYVNAHPDETVFNVGANTMLEYLIKFNQSRFVDWESFTCSFESEEFYSLLEFCSRFSGDEDVNSYPAISIADHDALLYEVHLVTPSDYLVLQQLLHTDSVSLVGFPTDDGSGIACEEMNPHVSRRYVCAENFTGEMVYFYIPTEEELQPIIDLLHLAEAPKDNDSTILDIILENAEEYFSGEKSAEEAASQIQSRVMLYLGERK